MIITWFLNLFSLINKKVKKNNIQSIIIVYFQNISYYYFNNTYSFKDSSIKLSIYILS